MQGAGKVDHGPEKKVAGGPPALCVGTVKTAAGADREPWSEDKSAKSQKNHAVQAVKEQTGKSPGGLFPGREHSAGMRSRGSVASGKAAGFHAWKKSRAGIRFIHWVTRVPTGFGKAVTAEYAPGAVTFGAEGEERVTVPARHEFLSGVRRWARK